MSIWILILVLAVALSIVLVLDAAARWNHGTSLVLDHYQRLLNDSRDRADALERAQRAKMIQTQSLSGHSTAPHESDSTRAEPPGPSDD